MIRIWQIGRFGLPTALTLAAWVVATNCSPSRLAHPGPLGAGSGGLPTENGAGHAGLPEVGEGGEPSSAGGSEAVAGVDGASGDGDGDHGCAGGPDGAAGSPEPPPTTVFTDAPPYEPRVRPRARELCGRDPSKLACLECHDILHSTPFAMGGTVFADAAGTMPAAAVEVRIVDAMGVGRSTFSDEDGNFWLTRAEGDGAPPFNLGIRDGVRARFMPIVAPLLDCNRAACHGGAVAPIHLGAGE